MRRSIVAIAVLAIIIPALNSCIFDAQKSEVPPIKKNDGVYRSLEQRDDVLHNLELAYNQRKIGPYEELLDQDFVFHFSPADISNNNVSVSNWDRPAELAATANMFDRNYSPPNRDPISSIDLDIQFADSADNWNPVQPDPVKYPGETWYVQNVDYFLQVKAGQWTYTSGNTIKASFTVRPVDVNGKTIWRIVIWRDDI